MDFSIHVLESFWRVAFILQTGIYFTIHPGKKEHMVLLKKVFFTLLVTKYNDYCRNRFCNRPFPQSIFFWKKKVVKRKSKNVFCSASGFCSKLQRVFVKLMMAEEVEPMVTDTSCRLLKTPLLPHPLLREFFPQIYSLIRKIFLVSSPPDSVYIGGLPPPGKKL